MIDGMFIGIWLAGFMCGVGITGKLMTKYYKAGWKKPHIQQQAGFNMPKGYVHRKR